MNDAEKKEAMAEEERVTVETLARSMQRLRGAVAVMDHWIAKPTPLCPAFGELRRAAFDVESDSAALMRIRMWRQRFA